MTIPDFAVFDTAIGRCAIAWGPGGIVRVQLPEGREADTRARVLRLHPGARETRPPHDIQSALDAIVALLGGAHVDLSLLPLDMAAVPAFHRRVYEVARTIPPGNVR